MTIVNSSSSSSVSSSARHPEVIVAKFGGSSVRDAAAMQACGKTIAQYPAIRLVILSATYNTTNELEQMAAVAAQEKTTISGRAVTACLPWPSLLKVLEQKHRLLAQDLAILAEVEDDLTQILEGLRQDLTITEQALKLDPVLMAKIYAVGELLSSKIFTAYLKKAFPQRQVVWLDSRQYIITHQAGNGVPIDFLASQRACQALATSIAAAPPILYVAQGFIGQTADGRAATLGREGSDYSATAYAGLLKATTVQIWTDVAGIATSDPHQIKHTKFLQKLSYGQAAALAEQGAKVLHERTMEPLIKDQIKLVVAKVGSTAPGTWIGPEDAPAKLLAIHAKIAPGPEATPAAQIFFLGNFSAQEIQQDLQNFFAQNYPAHPPSWQWQEAPKGGCLQILAGPTLELWQKLHDYFFQG
jgi:aspartate kinase